MPQLVCRAHLGGTPSRPRPWPARLGAAPASAGKERLFTALKDRLWGAPGAAACAELAARPDLSKGALKVTVHRLRQRFRELLRDDYVPTGWKGPGVRSRAVRGHEFGPDLFPEDRAAPIAFLNTP